MALTIGQEKCVNTLDKPLAVSAGAGSGKTFTLTRRIVHALESGYLTDIDQVLAITFTSKAAGEIKSRVKGALRAGGMTEQALKTDEAWISTIHGMCSRILRAHALELGLDPAFKVADEATVRTLLDASLEEVLGGRDDLVTVAEGVSSQRLDALFASFDVHPAGPRTASVEGMVRQLVEAASAHPDGMASVVAPPEAPSPVKLLAQLVDVADTAYALADGVKPGSTRDKFLAATQDALEGARELIGRGSDGLTYRRVLSAMNGFPVPGRNFGKNTPYGEQAAELAEQYCAIAAQARCGLVQEQLATLIDVAKSVADAFARRKREAGLLDNNDLLSFASRAFRDHPAIQAAYADRFKLVMVDEFQDTDQLQVDMIKRMAGEGFSRMCTVGDAQQSIYRFRGADVSVYRRHLEDVRRRNPEGIIELPDNFRSHGDVLALCDRIFEQPQVFGAEFMSLAPGREESKVKRPFLPDDPRVQVQVTVTPSRGVSSADAAAVAARHFDAAFVCTAPLTHAGIIGELLDAGLPVFTELNLVDDGYDALIAKAAQKGLPLFLSSTMLYRAETQYIKRRVAAFAKPVNYIYHIGQYLPDWHPWENYKNFFVGDRRTGGVREIFGIDLPWLLDAFGPVKHVYAEKDKLSGLEIDYPDSYFVTLRHENGTKGLLAADVVSPKAVRNFEVFGEGLHLFWEGNPRALYSYNAETREKEFVDTYGSFEHDARYSDNIVENAYVDEITNFFGVLAGREQPRWSFDKDKEAIALIERIEGA